MILQWLKRPGQQVASLEQIALLVGDKEWLLLVPDGCSGLVGDWLANSGSRVVPCTPVIKILVTAGAQDGDEQKANDGLSETAPPFAHAPSSHRAIVARIMRNQEVVVFASIGAVALVGILLAACSTIASAFWPGPLPPLFGGLCLAVVAGALAYGRHRLRSSNG
jgi:hypothetical protein